MDTVDFREKKLELSVAATGATDPEKEVEHNGKNMLHNVFL